MFHVHGLDIKVWWGGKSKKGHKDCNLHFTKKTKDHIWRYVERMGCSIHRQPKGLVGWLFRRAPWGR